MNSDTISLRRRHLMIAGLTGLAAPSTVLAGQRNSIPSAALASRAASAGAENLVVSGRILGAPDGKPLAGAMIEIWSDPGRALCTSVISDADGRFVFAARAPIENTGRPRRIYHRVSHNGRATPVTRLAFAGTPVGADDLVARLQRDEAAVWRASFGVTLA